GRGVAPAGLASRIEAGTDEVGIGKVRAVFLDRDGVLNEAIIRGGKPYPPRDLGEFAITASAPASLDALKRKGFLLVVVTNQPDVARGRASRADGDATNAN